MLNSSDIHVTAASGYGTILRFWPPARKGHSKLNAANQPITTRRAGDPQSETIRNHAAFIWSVADLLRGDYKQSEYGKVVLPLTVIRRLDCVLEPTKHAVLEKHMQLAGRIENIEPVLQAVAGEQFYNTSPLTFTKLLDDPNTIADSLQLYIGGFSPGAKDVIDKFDFGIQIDRLRRANVLYQVIGKFAEIDLHPDVVSNIEMGYLYACERLTARAAMHR